MDHQRIIGVANTDMITLHDAKLSGCCPSFHEEKASACSFHFYVKNTGATDITWQDVANMGFNSFVNTKNTDISMVTNVDKKHVDFDTAGIGVWFEDNVTYNNNPLYGMWLGSADIGLTFRSVLDKIYNKQDLRDIQSAADNLERKSTQQQKQCYQTLFEKVAIGAVLGMISEKVKNTTLNIGEKITVTLNTPAGEQVWSKTAGDAGELGLSSDGKGMSMKFVSAEFIKTMMSWMQDTNGTCKFAQAFDCQKLYSEVLNQECFVLTDMRLTPTEEQAKEIIAFCKKLESCVTVAIN